MNTLRFTLMLSLAFTGCSNQPTSAPIDASDNVSPAVQRAGKKLQPFFDNPRPGSFVVATVKGQTAYVQCRRENDGSIWIEVPMKLVSDQTRKSGEQVSYFEPRPEPPDIKAPSEEVIVPDAKTDGLLAVLNKYGRDAMIQYMVTKDEKEYHKIIGNWIETDSPQKLAQIVSDIFEQLTSEKDIELTFEFGEQ